MSDSEQITQHKRMAMGQNISHGGGGGSNKFARGGGVGIRPSKSGIPTTPLTDAKRANGIPGLKKGGKAK